MREKKYANILDDYPEEVEEKIKDNLEKMSELPFDEVEQKLSMTRELKFKELQEAIDEDEKVEIEVEDAEDLSTTEEVEIPKEEVTPDMEEVKKEEAKEDTPRIEKVAIQETKEVEIKEEKKDNINDDIYLTSSFKPFKKRFRLKKVFKVLFMLILLAAIGVSLTYFLIIPIYNKYQASKPKAIFDASLTYVGEQLDKVVDLAWIDSDIFDVEMIFDFDSNIEGMEALTAGSFGIRSIVNPEKKQYENSYFVMDDKNNKYGYSIIDDGEDLYYKFTSNDTYLKAEREEDIYDFSQIEDFLNPELSNEEYKYYIDTQIKILKEIITEDLLSSEKDEIEVNGKTISVMKNSLKLDKDKLKKLEKLYNEKVLDDEKLLKIEATLNDMTISEVKELYEEVSTYEDDYSLVINIYTIKGDRFAGFDIEEDGFRNIYYYTYDGNFEAHFNLTEDEDCLTGKDCNLENQMIIDLVGTKKDDYTKVEIMLNDEDVGSLNVRSFNFEKVDFTYKLIISDVVFEGVITLDINKEKEEYGVGFSLEVNDEYVDMNIKINFDTDSKVNAVTIDNIEKYSDALFEKYYIELSDQLEENDLVDTFELFMLVLTDPTQITESELIESGLTDITM